MIQSLILVLALCADTFGASLAYGANRRKVSPGKVHLLNGKALLQQNGFQAPQTGSSAAGACFFSA